MKKLILLITGFLICSSCGIKGPPLPPLPEETVQGQKNWDEVEKATQPAPVIPEPDKTKAKPKPKKKAVTNEN